MCNHGTRAWVPKRCRRCSPCQDATKRKHIARIVHGFEGHNWFVFLTLTSVPSTTWPKLMTGFTRFISHLRRTQPDLQYVAVKEEGSQTGMKHLHIIMHSWEWHSYSDLVATWQRLTGAQGVYIKRLETARVASYAAKYVGKGNIGARKLVTYSKLWPQLPSAHDWAAIRHETLPYYEPPFKLEDSRGRLLEHLGKDCYHVEDVTLPHLETYYWLRSTQGLSWHPPPVPSVS